MPRMSKETQDKVLGYSTKVAGYVSEGMSPNDAIIKVARDHDVEQGHVQLLIQAHNNSSMNQHRKAGKDVFEKAGTYRVADPVYIFKELYPTNVKEAMVRDLRNNSVSDEYDRPPVKLGHDVFSGRANMDKAASAVAPLQSFSHPREPAYFVKKAHSLLKELENNLYEKHLAVVGTEQKIAASLEDLKDYFRKAYRDYSFKEANDRAVEFYGKSVQPIFNYVLADMPHLKKEAARAAKFFSRDREPFSLVEDLLVKFAEHKQQVTEKEAFYKEATAASAQLLNQFLPHVRKGHLKMSASGSFGDAMMDRADEIQKHLGYGDKGLLGEVWQSMMPPSSSDLKSDAYMAISDPKHQQQLQGIKARGLLSNILNHDQHTRGEDPRKVTNLFNQISTLSPHATQQPLVTKALLRQFLGQGIAGPHDLDLALGMEGKMKSNAEPMGGYNLPKLPGNLVEGK